MSPYLGDDGREPALADLRRRKRERSKTEPPPWITPLAVRGRSVAHTAGCPVAMGVARTICIMSPMFLRLPTLPSRKRHAPQNTPRMRRSLSSARLSGI